MVTAESSVYAVASTLLTEMQYRLQSSIGGSVQVAGVVPGLIAWDACACGQLAIGITRQFLSEVFPSDGPTITTASMSPCTLPYRVADMSIGVARCAPNPNERGEVSWPALDTAAQATMSDAYHILTGAQCSLNTLANNNVIDDYAIRAQDVIGPLGGCVGSELRVSVSFINSCPCE